MFDSPEKILLWVGILVAFVLFQFIFCYLLLGYILYTMHLVRTKKTKWTRECSSTDPRHLEMYDEGCAWAKANQAYKHDLHMVNEGFNLYAEYYDFGYDRVVIMVSGRTEGLRYGYYFAQPYHKSGFNVLCIDQRAHGNSDGKYNTLGFNEHRDLIAWAKLLHEQYGVKSVMLHGICIGASCALQALISEDCPAYMSGLVADGMYPTFNDSFKNHMIELKKQVYPALWIVNMWMKLYTGYTMTKGNIHFIDRYRGPMLFLHSKQDLYSLPEMTEKLYEKCGSEQKELVWFPEGQHSMLRYTDKQRYDAVIGDWLDRTF